jgi:hypothetical protein
MKRTDEKTQHQPAKKYGRQNDEETSRKDLASLPTPATIIQCGIDRTIAPKSSKSKQAAKPLLRSQRSRATQLLDTNASSLHEQPGRTW